MLYHNDVSLGMDNIDIALITTLIAVCYWPYSIIKSAYVPDSKKYIKMVYDRSKKRKSR